MNYSLDILRNSKASTKNNSNSCDCPNEVSFSCRYIS